MNIAKLKLKQIIKEEISIYLKESSRYPGLELVPEDVVKKIIVAVQEKAPDKEKLTKALILAHQSLLAAVSDPGAAAPAGTWHAIAKDIDVASNVLANMPQIKFDKKEEELIASALITMGLPKKYALAHAATIRRG
jgi:hypothetical protein